MTVARNVAFGLEMRGVRGRGAGGAGDGDAAARPGWSRWRRGCRASSRAGSSSAWRWPARWRSGRACCCWTSRCPTWTRRCGPRSGGTSGLLQRSPGLTTVMVTHDQDEAMAMADRLVVMREGRVQQTGTQEDLYERPATPFVASFIGRSNMVEGTLEAGSAACGRCRDRSWPGAMPGRAPARWRCGRSGCSLGTGRRRRAAVPRRGGTGELSGRGARTPGTDRRRAAPGGAGQHGHPGAFACGGRTGHCAAGTQAPNACSSPAASRSPPCNQRGCTHHA